LIAEFTQRYPPRMVSRLLLYGDPAGETRNSTTGQSDWAMMVNDHRMRRYARVEKHVASAAPLVVDRVNAVNKMFKNAAGETKLWVDPRCKMLRRDLANVRWKRDSAGNTTGQLEKTQKDLTHISDALGYVIESKWGRMQGAGEQDGFLQ
jgi:hypothetical protein